MAIGLDQDHKKIYLVRWTEHDPNVVPVQKLLVERMVTSDRLMPRDPSEELKITMEDELTAAINRARHAGQPGRYIAGMLDVQQVIRTRLAKGGGL